MNAKQYPDQKWMLINDVVDQPNVAGYIWANHETSFQARVLAGTTTTRELTHRGHTRIPAAADILARPGVGVPPPQRPIGQRADRGKINHDR